MCERGALLRLQGSESTYLGVVWFAVSVSDVGQGTLDAHLSGSPRPLYNLSVSARFRTYPPLHYPPLPILPEILKCAGVSGSPGTFDQGTF